MLASTAVAFGFVYLYEPSTFPKSQEKESCEP